MPIYYALIARGHVVLCEFSDVTGNFDSMARSILGGLEHRDVKITYVSGQYLFHVVVENGLVFLCVADSTFDRTIAFNYLFEIRRQLSAMRLTERARTGDRHALREEFCSVLERELHRYSSGDQLTRLQDRVDEVKGIMTENIDKVVKRGDALDDLSERSHLLENNTTVFRVSATKLKRKLWWKNVKIWVCILFVILVILAIIAAIIALAASGKFK